MKIVDPTFGINNQAIAVLSFMENFTPDFVGSIFNVRFETKPWYNGREKGIVISMIVNFNKTIHIAFFEHRNSDRLCCLKWITDTPYYNHPLDDSDVYTKAYKNGDKYSVDASFNYGGILPCAEFIYDEFEDFYNDFVEKEKEKQKGGLK